MGRLEITEEGVKIDGILIDEEIFQQEKVNWSAQEREDEIDNLIDWISEAKPSDKELMKTDLKYLIHLNDEYIFSSILTNEYVAESDDKETFDEICEEILNENTNV